MMSESLNLPEHSGPAQAWSISWGGGGGKGGGGMGGNNTKIYVSRNVKWKNII
jgi:hypothetical protein